MNIKEKRIADLLDLLSESMANKWPRTKDGTKYIKNQLIDDEVNDESYATEILKYLLVDCKDDNLAKMIMTSDGLSMWMKHQSSRVANQYLSKIFKHIVARGCPEDIVKYDDWLGERSPWGKVDTERHLIKNTLKDEFSFLVSSGHASESWMSIFKAKKVHVNLWVDWIFEMKIAPPEVVKSDASLLPMISAMIVSKVPINGIRIYLSRINNKFSEDEVKNIALHAAIEMRIDVLNELIKMDKDIFRKIGAAVKKDVGPQGSMFYNKIGFSLLQNRFPMLHAVMDGNKDDFLKIAKWTIDNTDLDLMQVEEIKNYQFSRPGFGSKDKEMVCIKENIEQLKQLIENQKLKDAFGSEGAVREKTLAL